jgi:hypothetical protein
MGKAKSLVRNQDLSSAQILGADNASNLAHNEPSPKGDPALKGDASATLSLADVSSIASLIAQSTTERRRRGAAVSPGWSEAESWVGVHYKSESLQGRQALTPTAECIPGS